MKCPKCSASLSPLRIWLVSRWSSLKCGKCGTSCIRKQNKQLYMICALAIVPYSFIGLNVIYLIWVLLVMFLDAYTVKLFPAEAN